MVKKIVIVGGGSSGWMTASYLSSFLQGIDITLTEASDIPVVGVGESTVPPIVDFMSALGLKEEDWIPKCNATFKSAIGFKNFYENDGRRFWYPFTRMETFEGRPISRYWLRKHRTDPSFADRFTFYDYCYIVPEVCRQGRTVHSIPNLPGHAYHFDAALVGEYLKGVATRNGVEHIVDTIAHVERAEDGSIRSLGRQNGPQIEGDLFIDCTGFGAFLLDKTLEEPFHDYYDYLFNDRAVAMRIPYEDKESEMFSYTMCTAVSSGWIWTIPLYNRIGTGYVYCSRYKSEQEAEDELRAFWGHERLRDVEASHIKIRVGKHRRTWVKNCIGVGLSSGFIEPLESTGLFIVQAEVDLLMRTLKERLDYNVGDVAVYNDSVTTLFESIRDFLVCHYALTNREDTEYWRDVKFSTRIPEGLSAKLQLARSNLPDAETLSRFDNVSLAGFRFSDGWPCILVGMNFLPFDYEQARQQGRGVFEPHITNHLGAADDRYAKMREAYQKIGTFPSHYRYLRENFYGADE